MVCQIMNKYALCIMPLIVMQIKAQHDVEGSMGSVLLYGHNDDAR